MPLVDVAPDLFDQLERGFTVASDVFGAESDNDWVGTADNNLFFGLGGNDKLVGDGPNDAMGDDLLSGGANDDIILGDRDADLIDEVFVLSAAIRYYHVGILARFACGLKLEAADIAEIRQHLQRNDEEIARVIGSAE